MGLSLPPGCSVKPGTISGWTSFLASKGLHSLYMTVDPDGPTKFLSWKEILGYVQLVPCRLDVLGESYHPTRQPNPRFARTGRTTQCTSAPCGMPLVRSPPHLPPGIFQFQDDPRQLEGSFPFLMRHVDCGMRPVGVRSWKSQRR